MNISFNNALKQSTTIRKDLAALSSHPGYTTDPSSTTTTPLTPAALGSLSASLTAFSRTVDEYAALARQELNPAKAEKAQERLRNFRAELTEFRTQFDALKIQRDEAQATQNRAELLGRRPFVSSTPENPYANAQVGASSVSGLGSGSGSGYGYGGGGSGGHLRTGSGSGGGTAMGSGDVTREEHALREQNFFASTNSALDEYIARGQAVLGDLGQQREMLKNTQKRLYSVGNTLGISGDTIRMIERRALQDKWIFGAGVVVFFLFCWLVMHYLR